MSQGFAISALAPDVKRDDFRCGAEALGRYFREIVTQDIKRRVASCYVARGRDGRGGGVLYALRIERAAHRPARGDAEDAAALSLRARGADRAAGGGRAVQGDETRGGAAVGRDRAGGGDGFMRWRWMRRMMRPRASIDIMDCIERGDDGQSRYTPRPWRGRRQKCGQRDEDPCRARLSHSSDP